MAGRISCHKHSIHVHHILHYFWATYFRLIFVKYIPDIYEPEASIQEKPQPVEPLSDELDPMGRPLLTFDIQTTGLGNNYLFLLKNSPSFRLKFLEH